MKRWIPPLCALIVAMAPASAQTNDPADEAPSGPPIVEMLHLWRTQPEQNALAVFRDQLIGDGVTWSDSAVDGNFISLQKELSTRVGLGVPPNVVQWIVGPELQVLVKQGMFRLIGPAEGASPDQILPEVLELVAHEDGLASVPVGIHVQNYSVFNKQILTRFGLEVPETWDQLISYGPILKEHGIALMATSDQPWQRRNVWAAILSTVLTEEQFTRLQKDGAPVDDLVEPLTRAFRIFQALMSYANDDQVDLPWEQVSYRVRDGAALFQLQGDYIVPNYPDLEAIICQLPPEANFILWGVDSFALLNVSDPALRAGQRAFVQAALDPENARAYVIRKGGLPVVKGIRPEELTGCHAENLARWQSDTPRVLSTGDAWKRRLAVISTFTPSPTDEAFSPEAAAQELIALIKGI